jgi:dihydrofolate reductase
MGGAGVSVRALKAQPGKTIARDGSSQHALFAHDLVDELHLLVYPLTLGSGKRVLPNGVHATFALKSATPLCEWGRGASLCPSGGDGVTLA